MQTKTKLKLHYHEESIEGCIIRLTLSLLHLKHELVPITEANKELTRKNPTLFDGEMVFEEARAACTYLVSKYAISPTQKDLYPLQDVTTKAKIDQKLYFDAGTFYATLRADYEAVVHHGSRGPSKELSIKYSEILTWITDMVKSGYVAGTKEMTLADVSLLTTFVCLKALGSVDTRAYPFVEAWAQRCKQQLPRYEEVCGHAMEALGSLYKQSKATNGRP